MYHHYHNMYESKYWGEGGGSVYTLRRKALCGMQAMFSFHSPTGIWYSHYTGSNSTGHMDGPLPRV